MQVRPVTSVQASRDRGDIMIVAEMKTNEEYLSRSNRRRMRDVAAPGRNRMDHIVRDSLGWASRRLDSDIVRR
jgi:hypothetical protein